MLLCDRTTRIDLLLTDLELGDGSGADLIALARDRRECRALTITVFSDVQTVVLAIQAGADGYLLKSGSDRTVKCSTL